MTKNEADLDHANRKNSAVRLLWREFDLAGIVRSAVLRISGLFLPLDKMGARGNYVIDMVQGDNEQRVFYVIHDVVALVVLGINTIGKEECKIVLLSGPFFFCVFVSPAQRV